MATSDLAPSRGILHSADARSQASTSALSFGRVIATLASLRLTVALFALSIILIFLGTLAQKDNDVWKVVNDTYFRVWFARVDFQVFERLAQLFFKTIRWDLTGGFYFFGGKTLGLCLLTNLLAAHAIRFKVAATGRRLYVGLLTIAAGVLVTYFVVRSGMNQTVESELSPQFCDLLWQTFRGTLAIAALAGMYGLCLWFLRARERYSFFTMLFEWRFFLAANSMLAVLALWLLLHPDWRLDDSGIRILWQLAKGSAAGLALLAGCVMVFRKRAGIVLLHSGVALIMLTELFTAVAAVESQMSIAEGETAKYSSDIRTSELAVIDHSPTDHDQVTVVPRKLLESNVGSASSIDDPALPFNIRVSRWIQNAQVRTPEANEKNPATAGYGEKAIAVSIPSVTGVGDDSEKVDLSAAYIDLISKKTGESLGTYLVAQGLIDQPVEVDGHTYDLSLRFKRLYHPFALKLEKFRYDRYVGTDTPKNFSSQVSFSDPDHNVKRDVVISMNNPLRYGGTTFYQSGWDKETERGTVLQVVSNPSWMTPYVACMLVAIGMLAHFGTMLVRFLRRRADESTSSSTDAANFAPNNQRRSRRGAQTEYASLFTSSAFWVPAVTIAFAIIYICSKAAMPTASSGEMQIYEFAKMPVVYEGRVKPFDTLARNSLQYLSGRQELAVLNDKGEVSQRLPAIKWLLDAISGAPAASDDRVFRIEDIDLIDALDLPHRPQYWRYSISEIRHKEANDPSDPEIGTELQRQVKLAIATPEKERSLFQSKVIELYSKFIAYANLVSAFQTPQLSMKENEVKDSFQAAMQRAAELSKAGVPRAVPPADASTNWTFLMQAELDYISNQITKQPLNPATPVLYATLASYSTGDIAGFNKGLGDYRELLSKYQRTLDENAKELVASGVAKSEIMSQSKAGFEVFFNQFSPFYYAAVLYVFAFILGILSWVGWTQPLRRASISLLWFTFALHTFALGARIYISGRPPITNLYSTAIFIGWAVVLMSLAFESIHRLGLGNIVASVIGFLTLVLAYNLSLDGDTFIVLRAVLDTQFWLATHVVTINLGYAATYLTGAWGIVYIMFAHVFPVLETDARHKLLRILYGTLCFAIFFSFVGTVLGGLWADDSWGRFWGWDPKENGALMIVLWNALVLHARWGALVKGRGLAILAVLGNIVTTWSYFGVNEYGVGMHAYGASERSTAMWLLTFGISQLAIVALAAMPPHWFESLKLTRKPTA
ncbi:MAG TPA: cytochrome c biogenesis protein CcsA [Lacipirellulaceae bacterium]|nr:cytochrome c biogenesis protein CcsA [Lacipirellulaceae bacterium]